jgi:hypothetical protein
MAKRSDAQEAAVRKAGRVSGERRKAAVKRRQDTEWKDGTRIEDHLATGETGE